MNCGKRGLDLCKQFEGCEKRLKDGRYIAYLDTLAGPKFWSPGYNGLWTIGYGSTGPYITEGTIWTKEQCEAGLLKEMNAKAVQLNAYLRVKLNQNQFDALCCAAYNLGVAGMRTVLDAINAGDNELAMRRLVNHNHASGKVVAGLTRRRYAEKELFEWETKEEVVALSKPLQQANTIQNTTAVGGFSLAAMWNYLPQVKEFMQDHTGMILLAVVGTVLGINYLYQKHWHNAFDEGTYVPVGTKPVPVIPEEELPVEETEADVIA